MFNWVKNKKIFINEAKYIFCILCIDLIILKYVTSQEIVSGDSIYVKYNIAGFSLLIFI